MRIGILVLIISSTFIAMALTETPSRRPVIDVHMHAGPKNWTGPGAPSDPANEDHLRNVLSMMDRFNVKLTVISGPMEFVEHWKTTAPDRFIASVMFPCIEGRAPLWRSTMLFFQLRSTRSAMVARSLLKKIVRSNG